MIWEHSARKSAFFSHFRRFEAGIDRGKEGIFIKQLMPGEEFTIEMGQDCILLQIFIIPILSDGLGLVHSE